MALECISVIRVVDYRGSIVFALALLIYNPMRFYEVYKTSILFFFNM